MFWEIASAIVGGISLFTNSSTNSKMNELSEDEKILELKQEIGEAGISIKEHQDVIGVYDDFLEYAAAQDQFSGIEGLEGRKGSRTNIDARAKEIYNRVYENLGLANLSAGATGRIGGSMGEIGIEETEKVHSDIKTAASQLDVYKTSLTMLKEAKDEYTDMLFDLEDLDDLKDSALYKTDADFKARVDKEIAKEEAKKQKEKEEKEKHDEKEDEDRGYGWGDDWSGHSEEGGKYDRDTSR